METILKAKFGDRRALLGLWQEYHRLGVSAIPRRWRGEDVLGHVWEALVSTVASFDAQYGAPGFRGYFKKTCYTNARRAWKWDTVVPKPQHLPKAEYDWTTEGVYETDEDWSMVPEQLTAQSRAEDGAIGADAYRRLPEKCQRVVQALLGGGAMVDVARELGVSGQAVSLMMAKAVRELEAPKVCQRCGERLGPGKKKYCCAECEGAAYVALYGKEAVRNCGFCGSHLKGRLRSYCSRQCRRLAALKVGVR